MYFALALQIPMDFTIKWIWWNKVCVSGAFCTWFEIYPENEKDYGRGRMGPAILCACLKTKYGFAIKMNAKRGRGVECVNKADEKLPGGGVGAEGSKQISLSSLPPGPARFLSQISIIDISIFCCSFPIPAVANPRAFVPLPNSSLLDVFVRFVFVLLPLIALLLFRIVSFSFFSVFCFYRFSPQRGCINSEIGESCLFIVPYWTW